tara:strand:- start:3817 stop:5280 length:1464 start_codon:yes stop_codon:yes gene_type:complete
MAEIAPLNLSSPVYNPMSGASQTNAREEIRAGRREALSNALRTLQIKDAQYGLRQKETMRRADEYLSQNYNLFQNKKASILDPSSWRFSKGETRENMFKDWKENVGGGYSMFNQMYEAGKQQEAQSMVQRMIFDRNATDKNGNALYRTDQEYKIAFSDALDGMDPATRNQLYSNLPGPMYQQVMSMYLSKDDREGWTWSDVDDALINAGIVDTREGAQTLKTGIAGLTGVAATAWLMRRGLSKSKATKFLQITAKSDVLAKHPQRIMSNMKMPNPASTANIAGGMHSATRVMPNNQISAGIKEINAKLAAKQIDGKEAKAMVDALKKLKGSGSEINAQNIATELGKSGSGKGLINKVKGGLKWAVVPMAGMAAFSAVGGLPGQVLGSEKMEGVGNVAGGTMGALASQSLYDTAKKAVKSKGWSWVVKKVMQKGGPKLAMRTVAKAGLSGASGVFSGGVGWALGLGWAATDIVLIANILREAEQEGDF